MFRPGATDPSEKLAYYVAWSKQAPQASLFASTIERLRKQGHPMFTKEQPIAPTAYLPAETLGEVGRWTELIGAL